MASELVKHQAGLDACKPYVPGTPIDEVQRQYGLEDVCVFTGERHDMPELYALMDLFVLPSHREGFPRSPMEASAMGVPSVVTDIRGCREAVQHGQNGWLVPLGDVPALVDAIERMRARFPVSAGNPAQLRRNALQHILAHDNRRRSGQDGRSRTRAR